MSIAEFFLSVVYPHIIFLKTGCWLPFLKATLLFLGLKLFCLMRFFHVCCGYLGIQWIWHYLRRYCTEFVDAIYLWLIHHVGPRKFSDFCSIKLEIWHIWTQCVCFVSSTWILTYMDTMCYKISCDKNCFNISFTSFLYTWWLGMCLSCLVLLSVFYLKM
jgi:hypothetical protein